MWKGFLDRYRSIPTPAKAALWFIVCNAVQSGCKFLAMPLLVRLLTTEQYGIYSVFLSWTSILAIFATLNLHAGVYNNAMLRYPDRRSEYTSASQGLAMATTGTTFCAYCLSARWADVFLGMEHWMVLLIFLQLFFTEGFQLWSTRQRYEYKYVRLLVYTAVLSVSYVALPVLAAYFAPPKTRLYAVIAAGVAVQVVFGGAFIVYNYVKSRCFFVWEFWRYALRFNIPLIPHYLSNVILGQADRVMIKRYIGPAQAGIYSVVYNISLAATVVTGAVNSAVIPHTYEKLSKRAYADLRRIANILLLMVGAFVVALSMMAPEIIKIIATEEYYESASLVPVIAMSVYFTFLYSLFGNVEFYFGANRFIAAASALAAAANIVLNYLCIPVLGYYAAAWTTLVCYGLLSLAHYVFMQVVCKQRIGSGRVYDSDSVLLISIAVSLLSMCVMLIYDYPLIRYFVIASMVLVTVWQRKRWLGDLRRLIGGVRSDNKEERYL